MLHHQNGEVAYLSVSYIVTSFNSEFERFQFPLHISDTSQRYLLKVGFSQTGRPAKRIGCPMIICSRWKLLQGFQSLFQLARESPYFVCSCTHVQDAKHHQRVLVQIVLKPSCTSGFVQETIHFIANLASLHLGLARDVD